MDRHQIASLVDELSEFGRRFWAGEAEIAREFWSSPRTADEQARWLRHQCYRELHGPGLFDRPQSQVRWIFDQVNAGMSFIASHEGRVEIERRLEALRQEFTHFRLLADILEDLTGEAVKSEDLMQSTWEEECILEELRAGYLAESPKLARIAFDFTEGGGAGVFYTGCSLSGDPVSDRIAHACQVIYADEAAHSEHGAHEVAQELESAEECSRVREMVIAICEQRLRVRYQMFGLPINVKRIREITRGKIEPLNLRRNI